METTLYKLMFDGAIQEGEEAAQVKTKMAALFRTDAQGIEKLFGKPGTVLKRGLTQQHAIKYKQALQKTGAICRIVPEKKEPASGATQPTPRTDRKTSPQKDARRSSDEAKSPVKDPPKTPERKHAMLSRSKIPYHGAGWFSKIIWPVVLLKNLFEAVYDSLIETIWHELMGKKQQSSQASQLILFFLLSLISLGFYYARDYEDAIFIGLFALWGCDFLLAKHTFFQGAQQEEFLLSRRKNGQILWKQICHDGECHQTAFAEQTITQIAIERIELLGGAFQEIVGYAWQVYLRLDDASDFLITRQQSVNKALRTAQKLAADFEVPLIFLESEGAGPLASRDSSPVFLKNTHFASGSVTCQQHADTSEISTSWTLRNVWRLLKTVVGKAGFFLFLLIMYGILVRFGMLLNFYIGPYFGLPAHLTINLSLSGILSLFKPEGGVFEWIELAIVSAIILYNGWKFSRRKTIIIDSKKLEYRSGLQTIETLNAQELHAPLLLMEPAPLLLLLDNTKSIEIKDLQTEHEFRAFKAEIEKCLKPSSDRQ